MRDRMIEEAQRIIGRAYQKGFSSAQLSVLARSLKDAENAIALNRPKVHTLDWGYVYVDGRRHLIQTCSCGEFTQTQSAHMYVDAIGTCQPFCTHIFQLLLFGRLADREIAYEE